MLARRTSGRWARRTVTTAVLVVGLLAVTAGSALAVPSYIWRSGHFMRAGVPVYAEPVDGWMCHLFGACRSADRGPDDPGPAWHSGRMSEPVRIECQLGAYYKLREPHPGWVLAEGVHAHAEPVGCYAGDF